MERECGLVNPFVGVNEGVLDIKSNDIPTGVRVWRALEYIARQSNPASEGTAQQSAALVFALASYLGVE
jgi:hypothetical protein